MGYSPSPVLSPRALKPAHITPRHAVKASTAEGGRPSSICCCCPAAKKNSDRLVASNQANSRRAPEEPKPGTPSAPATALPNTASEAWNCPAGAAARPGAARYVTLALYPTYHSVLTSPKPLKATAGPKPSPGSCSPSRQPPSPSSTTKSIRRPWWERRCTRYAQTKRRARCWATTSTSTSRSRGSRAR